MISGGTQVRKYPNANMGFAFRHCFATYLLQTGYNIRTVQELLVYKHIKTAMIYTHVLNRGPKAVRSPLY